jgi:serine protease DegQ
MRPMIVGIALLLPLAQAPADDPKPPAAAKPAASIQVPYRLTATQHVMVRVKINGKGPFNFILDTGAPVLFVATKIADKAGVKADKQGWAAIDRFEIEGGVVLEKPKGKVDDLFQLEGMNGLGLAGAELHGVLGYNVLARYRIEYDFTRPKLAWTPLDFNPPVPVGLGKSGAPAGLDAIGSIMKVFGALLGTKANVEVQPRGFIGVELADGDHQVTVKRVLTDGPAAQAGLRAGDRITHLGGIEIEFASEITKRVAKLAAGAKLEFKVVRDGAARSVVVEVGKGL